MLTLILKASRMCGFTGFLSSSEKASESVLRKMTDAIAHRGPDSDGHWIVENIAFGHRRLAILDLSPTGHQPMSDPSERYCIIFNGEIYNFKALAKNLSGKYPLKGSSDTEVLLHHIEEFGLETTLKKVCGMFSFALWDKKQKELILARDPMGEKPLYYGKSKGTFFFGSELKSFYPHPDFEKKINQKALALYFKYNNVPDPYSIFENIFKLSAGEFARFNEKGELVSKKKYYSLKETAESGLKNLISTKEQALKRLEDVLLEVVGEMMVTDVPYRAFLSSGIDSSTIVSLMQKISTTPVKTFSVGFEQKQFDESAGAKKIAKHLGTDHTELILKGSDTLDVVPELSKIYCEPFSDSSQIPTFLVSKLAREKVTVSLSGDAGDEMFAGYNRHTWIPHIWNKTKSIPGGLRSTLSGAAQSVSAQTLNSMAGFAGLKTQRPGDKIHQLAQIMKLNSQEEIYDFLTTHWSSDIVTGVELSKDDIPIYGGEFEDFVSQMLYTDQTGYLVNDILVKVDRAAMRNSLETRVPFLDKRLVELSWQIPYEMKHKGTQGKSILREFLFKFVPKEYYEGQKVGFAVPLESWLRTDLVDWSMELLDPKKLLDAGLNADLISKKWQEHQKEKANWHYDLWDVLMYMSWREEYL